MIVNIPDREYLNLLGIFVGSGSNSGSEPPTLDPPNEKEYDDVVEPAEDGKIDAIIPISIMRNLVSKTSSPLSSAPDCYLQVSTSYRTSLPDLL